MLIAHFAAAESFFTTDSVINTSLDNIIVGYPSLADQVAGTNGTSATVTVVPSGGIRISAAFNGSSIIVDGGQIFDTGILNAFDNASVILKRGGAINGGGLRSFDLGAVIMSGGTIGSVTSLDSSTMDVTGGVILSFVDLQGDASGKVSGVTIGSSVNGVFFDGMVNTRDSAELELSGVEVGLAVKATNNSKIKMSNSTIRGAVEGLDTTTLTITGGTIDASIATFNLDMSGVSVGGGVGVTGPGAAGTIGTSQISSGVSVNGAGASLGVSGGAVGGGASAGGGSTLFLSGVEIAQGVNGFNATISTNTANVGGDFSILASGSQGTATVTNSTISGNLSATGGLSATKNATITMTGGSVAKDVTANDRAAIALISASVLGNVTANSSSLAGSLVEIQGGSVAGNASSKGAGAEVRLSSGTINGDLMASDRADVKILGGDVKGNLVLANRASGTMSGGIVAGTAKLDAFTFTMIGGGIGDTMSVNQFSRFIMSDGALGRDLVLSGESTTNITGGSITGSLIAEESSTVEMGEGTVGERVIANGMAEVTLSGGQVNLGLVASGDSRVLISGGSVTQAEFKGDSMFTLSGNGVIVDGLFMLESSQIVMSGGSINGGAFVGDKATLTMHGGFSKTLTLDSSSAQLDGGTISNRVLTAGNIKLLVSGTASLGGDLAIFGGGTVTIEGGSIAKRVLANHNVTLNVSGSASIAGNLAVANDATVNMSGGRVGGDLVHVGNLQMTMSGGTVAGDAIVEAKSALVFTGGTIEGKLEASGTVQHSGTVNGVAIARGGALIVAGGRVGETLQAAEGGQVEVIGASAISGGAAAFHSSTLSLISGSIGVAASPGPLEAQGDSTVNLSGGTVGGNLVGVGNTTTNMSGGTVFGSGIFRENAKFNFTSGKVFGGIDKEPSLPALAAAPAALPLNVSAFDNAAINLYGGGLVSTLVDPDSAGMSKYVLSGTLADGTLIDGGVLLIQNGSQATQHLLPGSNWKTDGGGNWGEPGNWASGVIPEGAGAFAGFMGALTTPNAPVAIALGGNRSIGHLQFNNANAYSISGQGSLTLNNGGTAAQIEVFQGAHTIEAEVQLADDAKVLVASGAELMLSGSLKGVGRTIEKTGAGKLDVVSLNAQALDIQAGRVRVEGGSVQTLSIGAGGMLDLDRTTFASVSIVNVRGVLQLAPGATLTAPGVQIDLEGRLNGSGTVLGNVNNLGTVAPGNSPGILTISGDYTQEAGGRLLLDIAGLVLGNEHDQLAVTGNAVLGGTIVFSFIEGFAPLLGQTFNLLQVGGAFSGTPSFTYSGLEDGWQFSTTFNPAVGVFTLTSLSDGVATTIPEPGSVLLASVVSVTLLSRRHRKAATSVARPI
jgi:hypothetical protein